MQASAMDHLAAPAGNAPAAPDLPEGLGWTQCPHGYLEPVSAAEPPRLAPESPERRQSNSQLEISLLELAVALPPLRALWGGTGRLCGRNGLKVLGSPGRRCPPGWPARDSPSMHITCCC